jgi:hypothetical protein
MAFIILVAVLTIASGKEPAQISNGKENNDNHGDEDSRKHCIEHRHLHSSLGCAGTGTLPVALLVSLKSDSHYSIVDYILWSAVQLGATVQLGALRRLTSRDALLRHLSRHSR